MFEQHRDQWRPEAIHRAKSIGAIDPDCQLDFVDIGLLPAIEGEIHLNLHRLLCKTLESASHNTPGDDQEYLFARNLFSIIFRFLAAKVLLDRKHSQARDWSLSDPYSVLRGIESFYSLDPDPQSVNLPVSDSIAAAWECLQGGISFANIASDDSRIYLRRNLDNADTRKQFGTHSTPRQLAEYAVARLQLHRRGWDELRSLRIYEPFAGVAPFLISAIRHIRDLLPSEWSDAARHKFLTERISGDEMTPSRARRLSCPLSLPIIQTAVAGASMATICSRVIFWPSVWRERVLSYVIRLLRISISQKGRGIQFQQHLVL